MSGQASLSNAPATFSALAVWNDQTLTQAFGLLTQAISQAADHIMHLTNQVNLAMANLNMLVNMV